MVLEIGTTHEFQDLPKAVRGPPVYPASRHITTAQSPYQVSLNYTPNVAGEKANKKVYLALLVAVEYVACTDEPCLWDLERVGTPLSSGELADG